jgi:regulatory protein
MPRDTPPDALDAAVRLLALRPHSAVELRRKLRQRRCPPEEIEAALRRVRDLGYQSDAGFAETLVEVRVRTRGRISVASDLAARGVDRTVAAEALAGITPEVELSAARQVAARMRSIDPARLGGRLQRRGFSAVTVRQVVRERAAEQGDDPFD